MNEERLYVVVKRESERRTVSNLLVGPWFIAMEATAKNLLLLSIAGIRKD